MSERIGRLGETAAVHVWHGRARDTPDPADTALLDDVELRAAGARRAPLDARYAGAHAAVRRILADHYLGGSPAAIRFGRHRCLRCDDRTHGRPRVVMPATRLEFSLSRSGPHWLLAVTAGGQVGVDIEQRGEFDIGGTAEVALSDDERTALRAAGDERDRQDIFFRAWTRKEAVLKAVGVGIVADLRRLDVRPERYGPVLVEHAEPGHRGSWWTEEIPLGPHLFAALAREADRPGPVVLRRSDVSEPKEVTV